MMSEEKAKALQKEPFKTVIAERDNFNREAYQNLTWLSSNETIVQQSETVTSDVLTFMVPKTPPGDYYDLSSMRMQTTFKLVDEEEKKPEDNQVVGPINYFCQTMIKSVEVYVNGTQVISSTPYYAQKAMVEALLNHSKADREGILSNQGFLMDKPTNLEKEPTWASHEALRDRAEFFGNYVEVSNEKKFVFKDDWTPAFQIPLLTDLNKIDTPLVSKVDLKIIIHFHPPSHYLWTAKGDKGENKKYKFLIKNSQLRVKQLRAADGYTRSLEDQIEKLPLKYRFKRIEPLLEPLPSGEAVFTKSFNMITNLPERILIMIQPQSLLSSSYTSNPINWNAKFDSVSTQHKCELSDCELTINGNPVSRLKGSDFQSFASLHYQELLELTGNDTFGCGLEREYFGVGSYMILFDLTKSGRCSTSGSVRQPVKEGQAVLTIKFKAGSSKSLSILMLQEFNSSFTVDKNRKVLFNYLD